MLPAREGPLSFPVPPPTHTPCCPHSPQHWMEMVHAIGQKAPGPAAAELTERQVAEPILSYFSYGMLRPAPGVTQVRLGTS